MEDLFLQGQEVEVVFIELTTQPKQLVDQLVFAFVHMVVVVLLIVTIVVVNGEEEVELHDVSLEVEEVVQQFTIIVTKLELAMMEYFRIAVVKALLVLLLEEVHVSKFIF